MFYREVPIFKLLGSPKFIDPDIPYDIDSDVQLVCKYLRAYKTGAIDQMYYIKRSEISFGNESDLEEEECHQLLRDSMPSHICSSKITQKLFIK